jgi:hypothetical protein
MAVKISNLIWKGFLFHHWLKLWSSWWNKNYKQQIFLNYKHDYRETKTIFQKMLGVNDENHGHSELTDLCLTQLCFKTQLPDWNVLNTEFCPYTNSMQNGEWRRMVLVFQMLRLHGGKWSVCRFSCLYPVHWGSTSTAMLCISQI